MTKIADIEKPDKALFTSTMSSEFTELSSTSTMLYDWTMESLQSRISTAAMGLLSMSGGLNSQAPKSPADPGGTLNSTWTANVSGSLYDPYGGGGGQTYNRTSIVWPGDVFLKEEEDMPTYLRITTLIFLLSIFVIGTVGNSMVIIVIHCSRDMKTSTNIFLLNLSVADLLVLLICTPTCIMEVFYDPEVWMLGAAMCKLVSLLEVTVAHASVLTILAISFERYYAICCPLRANYVCTKTRAFTICLTTWLAAGIITSPMSLMVHYYVEGDKPRCDLGAGTFWADVYTISSNVIFFLLPFLILLVTYGLIAKNLCSDRSRLSQNYSRQNNRARQQVMMMLGTVVFTFFLCLLPFRVLTLYIVFSDSGTFDDIEVYYNILYFSRIMFYLNSALNPILYNIMSSKFRNGFLFLCSRKRRRFYRFQRRGTFHTMTTTSTASTTSNIPNNFIHTALPVQAIVTDRRTCRLALPTQASFGFNGGRQCCNCHCHHHHNVHHGPEVGGLNQLWNGSLSRAVTSLKNGSLTPTVALAPPGSAMVREGYSYSQNNLYCQNCVESGVLGAPNWECHNAASHNSETKGQQVTHHGGKCVCACAVRGHVLVKSGNSVGSGNTNCFSMACPTCLKRDRRDDMMFWADDGRNGAICKDGQKYCVRLAMKSNCYACTYSSLSGNGSIETIL